MKSIRHFLSTNCFLFKTFVVILSQEAQESSVLAFLEFLLERGPFDLVLDGLNIIYRESKKHTKRALRYTRETNDLEKYHSGFKAVSITNIILLDDMSKLL